MDTSLSLSTGSTGGNPPPTVFTQLDPRTLKPHPCNSSIYGEDEDVTELVSLIRNSGWVKPLVISNEGTIISGHRRWKAVLELEWESVPVEVREFPDEIAQLQALLLENASRFKTVEQKVREASAWKDIEKAVAHRRQLATQNNHTGRAVRENFPQLLSEKGRTSDRLAKLVGLGSGRTYSKAARVVEAIDLETSSGNLEKAQALRQVLNSKSVDAAIRLLCPTTNGAVPARSSNALGEKPVNSEEENDCTHREEHRAVGDPSNTSDRHTASPQRSCWNCQNRGELIENHSFYCYRLGAQSLLDKDADTRGTECDLWSDRWHEAENKADLNTEPTNYTLTLSFSAHLRLLIEDAAQSAGMSVVDWASYHLLEAATGIATATYQGSGTVNVRFTEKPSGGEQD